VLPRRDRKGAFCLGDVDWLTSEGARLGFHVMAPLHFREDVYSASRRDYRPCRLARDAKPLNYNHVLDTQLYKSRINVNH
jgi:hypothetical protein